MKIVDEELKPETVETFDLRGEIGFLLEDEVEAINGYDKVLKQANLTEEQRKALEEIRNDELEHVNNLNKIYRTLATGEIEEGNDIMKYNENTVETEDADVSKIKSEISKLTKDAMQFERLAERCINRGDSEGFYYYKENSDEIRRRIDMLRVQLASQGQKDACVRDYKSNELVAHIRELYKHVGKDKIEKYKEELKKAGGYRDLGTRLAWDILRAVTQSKGERISDWYDKYEVNDDHITSAGKKILKEMGVALNDSAITGADYEEADVNEPINPMCDGILESILNTGTGVFSGLSKASEIDEKPEKITDSNSINNAGRIALGNKYHWEKKYADRTLTISKIKKENLKLELNNTTYIILPIEKFFELLDNGEITSVSTHYIDKYDNIETTRDYKVSVGDKTYIVSAKSAKDAKSKIKKYRESK